MITLHKKISRKTVTGLDGTFGPDRDRPLVASLDAGDLIRLRPLGTRREEVLSLFDVYRFAIRCRVNREVLERARQRKLKVQAQRESRRLDAAERRMRERCKEQL